MPRSLAHPRLAASLGTRLVHTYTRTPTTESVVLNSDYSAEPVPGLPVVGEACKYEDRRTTITDQFGTRVAIVPTLYVGADSALAEGDEVSAVLNVSGATLQAGPFVVKLVVPFDGLGRSIMRRADLERSEARIEAEV